MDFKVGDYVYASDWCYGTIAEIENDIAHVEYETDCGGGCMAFGLDELEHAKSKSVISKLCYELYMVDWKRCHMITADREMDSIKNYYRFIEESDYNGNLYEYEDYIEEFGYDGELYVCYDEFLETDYLEDDYICGLLDNEELIAMYYKDIKE